MLGVGRETMSTLQQTVFALLSMLQQHRLMAGRDGIGREAWSEVAASDRRTARQIRVADPDVRLMRPEEGRAFDAAAARPGGVEVRRVTTPDGEVEVGVAPLGPGRGLGVAGPHFLNGFRDGFVERGRDLDRGRGGVGALRG